MMKTALFLSGDLRCYKDCYESLYHNILKPTKCDIFMQVNDHPDLLDAIKLYSPKKVKITHKTEKLNIDESKYSNKFAETNTTNVFYMWNGIKNAFSMIDDNYDCYIKCRYDIKFEANLHISSMNIDEINIPIGGDWRGGVLDMFCVTNYLNMKYYTQMIDFIDEYYDKGVVFHPETLLKFHLRNHKINRFSYPLIFRRKYDGSDYYSDRLFTV
jgi:hypothetical protein